MLIENECSANIITRNNEPNKGLRNLDDTLLSYLCYIVHLIVHIYLYTYKFAYLANLTNRILLAKIHHFFYFEVLVKCRSWISATSKMTFFVVFVMYKIHAISVIWIGGNKFVTFIHYKAWYIMKWCIFSMFFISNVMSIKVQFFFHMRCKSHILSCFN